MQQHILVLLLCALYGSVFVFGKLALAYSSPLFITGARMVLAGTLLFVYQFLFHRQSFKLFRKQQFWPIVIVAIAGVYLTNVLEFWGLKFIASGKACFLYGFAPIATALLSYIWLSEKINLKKALGLILGMLSFLPLLMADAPNEDYSGTFGFFSYAELAILAAAVTSSVGWLAMHRLVRNSGLPPVIANATTMLLGGAISLLHSFGSESWTPAPYTELWPFLHWFLILMLVSNIICYNLNSILLKTFSATYLSFAGLTQPFFAAFFGWVILNEVMSRYFWVSAIGVIFSLYLYYQKELEEGLTPRR